MSFITPWDFVLMPFYLLIIYVVSNNIQKKNIVANPYYKYYKKGLFIKIGGGIALCLVYTLYYTDITDTTGYFKSSISLLKLFSVDSDAYFSILRGNLTNQNRLAFTAETGWPWYYNDPQAFFVVRLTNLFAFFGMQKYFLTTVLVAWVNYTGVWKLYVLFVDRFKNLDKNLAIAILFLPSVVFWGSGVLKDSFTLSATGWLVYSVYQVIIKKEKFIYHIITIGISSYLLISLKPYILFSVLLGLLVWFTFLGVNKIKYAFLKVIVFPILIILIWGLGSLAMLRIGTAIGGAYASVDNMMEKAVVTQEDLTRAAYGTNSFDIGPFEASFNGILRKAPIAIVVGIFMPFIWQARSVLMIVSGLENFFYLILVALILKNSPFRILRVIFQNPFLLFCLAFSISFAFSIGLSTANFGALVRYKIPFLPFFVASLFIIQHKLKTEV